MSDDIAVDLTGTIRGTNGTYVITDNATGDILGLPAAGPFNLEGAGSGVCDIWYLRYEDGLTGLTVGQNVSGLTGCFDLSNAITVNREGVDAGGIEITGTGATSATICAGDGSADPIAVTMTGMPTGGDNTGWLITDNATGDILGLPAAGPFNLEGAGAGVCDIWYIAYADGLTGLTVGQNVSGLTGCFDLSNAITVNREGVDAGGIEITGTGATSTTICAGDGSADPIAVTMTGMPTGGANTGWLITDNATGDILGLPAAGPFNLEGAGAGVCDIWYIAYADGLTGLTVGQNVSGLTGCFDLSNAITVNREGVDAGGIEITGTGATSTTICAGDGSADPIAVTMTGMPTGGANTGWLITDNATGDILGLPAAGPFNLEGAGAGVCDIWYIAYADGLTGLTVGQNVSGLTGCFDLSNAITVNREGVDAGGIEITGTDATSTTICAGDGSADPIAVTMTGMPTGGANTGWLITDNATGDILGLPAAGPFNLEGAGAGVCDIWYIAYADGLTGLTVGQNVSGLTGCFDLSNAITVNREGVDAGGIEITGTGATSTTICAGDGSADPIAVTMTGMPTGGANTGWLITDNATGDILGLPAAGPFNLEGAGAGVCDIWYIAYADGLTGLTVGQNVSGLTGCFDLSNAITVNREGVDAGGIEITGTGATSTTICAGDGSADPIAVTMTGMPTGGANTGWLITDNATGDILGLPAAGPFNLEGAGAGVCDIWYIAYADGLTGLTVGQNVSGLTGCFDLSNAITVNREGVDAGGIEITGTGATSTTICAGDGSADPIAVTMTGMPTGGANTGWLITDNATGDILGLPAAGPFNLEGAGAGVCDIWYIAYADGLTGLTVGQNVSGLTGCFDLSNAITVNREGVDAGGIEITGTGATSTTICAGDGAADPIAVTMTGMPTGGANTGWLITDNATGDILGLPAAGPFNLEGAGAGVCDIWYIAYADGLTGLTVGQNVSGLTGCFDLSNAITVNREGVNGGAIQLAGTTDTAISICVGEGTDDLITTEFVDASALSGTNGTYVITDNATGNILGLPAAGPFNLEGAGAGVCDIWYLRYETGLTGLAMGQNISGLSGCFDLSNAISVTRLEGTDCNTLSIDEFSQDFNFSLYPNPTNNIVNIKYNGQSNLNLNVEVYDVLGKRITKSTFNNTSNMSVDLRSFSNGAYFLNILDVESGNRIVKRVIKN